MKSEDFDYELPPEKIAQFPAEKRGFSKMLVISRTDENLSLDLQASDLVSFLSKGDALVLNSTKVVSAKLFGKRKQTGGNVEIFLTEKKQEKNLFEALVKPSRRVRPGETVVLNNSGQTILIEKRGEGALRTVRFETDREMDWNEIDKIGKTPLPPYIKRPATEEDRNRYQTVYAGTPGAVAAPTAGLHITREMIETLEKKGVGIVNILLHVGFGTFAQLSDDVEKHRMHSEYYELSAEASMKINTIRKKGGRVFAVGTTSVRVLESCADSEGFVSSARGWTDVFIYPPYRFKTVDGLLTNFHLPRTSLICLVSAFAGRERILKAYKKALESGYMFASYGDAMLILP
ncbi:tRNA preQ1(34) S-adenosylmethionine ribosyltransferase-isomerase QueA [candidate division WOR-3 bacterium]|nr:tRNA preQ1(34) S-adenosylmethionine ribosyltransferase-isomerase QueA [candidate division WOR-3 bacterium]